MKVRLCDRNRGKGKVRKRLREKYPDLDVKVKKCIHACSECRGEMVARVDGKKVTAGGKKKLYRKVKGIIERD